MKNKYFSLCFGAIFLCIANSASGEKRLEDVEKFISEEIDKTHAPVKRSSLQVIPEVTSFHQKVQSEKPDKISVTILKEYKVQKPDGRTEYVSVQDEGGNIVSNMNPPSSVQEFIRQHVSVPQENLGILQAKDLTKQFQQGQRAQQLGVSTSSQLPIPATHKRNSMDGWLPIYSSSYIGPGKKGITQQYKELYAQNQFSKGAYYSPHKVALLNAASSAVPQVADPDVQIQRAIPHPNLNLFNLDQFDSNQGSGSKQRIPIYPGRLIEDPKKMVIHTQNVIINSNLESLASSEVRASENPNISQIKAYGSTLQISALLRERFRQNQMAHPLNGRDFPAGGMPLRSLAQAIRNGAFSIENDIIPSAASEKFRELEIMIPHRFKMRNPKVDSGYSNVNTQGTQQFTSASINQPISHLTYGAPPRINPTSSTAGLRDYGDSVKYALKEPIEILETQPVSYGAPVSATGGSSLNQLAAELEGKLRQLVQQEILMQALTQQQLSQQYGPPPVPQQSQLQSQYGAPTQAAPIEIALPGDAQNPLEEYGPPGQQPGTPLESYGITVEDGPSQEYHSDHLGPPQEHPKKPFTLNLDFDSGFWGEPHANIQVDSGDQIQEHGHDYHGHEHHGPDMKEEVKEQLVTFGKNLFHSALDFSRVYNPITFIEKVKEFPPIRFEVHDIPKKSHKKGHKKGHKSHGHGHKKGHRVHGKKGRH